MQVDGLWKDYLLTVSAARNPANNSIDKNKVLLTDVQTGLPVWQGLDVAGTQVEASPSGLFIVSTDSRGQAKIWKRVPDTLTYAALPNLVAAHTGTNADYIADVQVINDSYFVTAGLDKRMKLFRITDAGATLVQTFFSITRLRVLYATWTMTPTTASWRLHLVKNYRCGSSIKHWAPCVRLLQAVKQPQPSSRCMITSMTSKYRLQQAFVPAGCPRPLPW